MSEKQIDYSQYGYKEGTKIEIPENLYGHICELINYIGQKESVAGFEQKETMEETLGDKNSIKYVLTPQGIRALQVAMQLNQIHEQNVENGVAVHQSELEKPKVKLAQA